MTAESLTLSSQKNMPSRTNDSLTQPIWYNLEMQSLLPCPMLQRRKDVAYALKHEFIVFPSTFGQFPQNVHKGYGSIRGTFVIGL